MDDVAQENVAPEIKTRGPALARSKPAGESVLRAAIIKRKKKADHRRKLRKSHAKG